MRLARTWVLLAMIAWMGCAESTEACLGPQVSREAVVPHDDLRAELCRYLARCHPDDLRRFAEPTVEGCIAYERCAPAPEGHRVTEACLDAMRTSRCGEGGRRPGYGVFSSHECTIGGPFEHPREGERCRVSLCRPGGNVPPANLSCAEGLYCDRDDTCQPMIPNGRPCSLPRAPGVVIDPCETGAFCDFLDGLCRAQLEPGAACEVLMDDRHTRDPCRSPARCEEGVCVSPPEQPPRDFADASQPCVLTDDCRRGLACVDGVCAPLVCGGGVGAPCEPGTCVDDLVCHEEKSRCEPRGEPCDDVSPTCAAETYCSGTTLTCQSR